MNYFYIRALQSQLRSTAVVTRELFALTSAKQVFWGFTALRNSWTMHVYLAKQVKIQRHPRQCATTGVFKLGSLPQNNQLICTQHRWNSGLGRWFNHPFMAQTRWVLCLCSLLRPGAATNTIPSTSIFDTRNDLFHNYALKLMQFLIPWEDILVSA